MLSNTSVLEKNPPRFDLLLKVLFCLGFFLDCRKLLSTWQDIGAGCKLNFPPSFLKTGNFFSENHVTIHTMSAGF